MNIELTEKEFRLLLDLVYTGNWIMNSARGDDRIEDYDNLQEKIFQLCPEHGMRALVTKWYSHTFPSPAYERGGIHEAIADYEDAVFFDILAEEMARRDLENGETLPETDPELIERINRYFDEFEKNGIDNLVIEGES
jgi:hypothetical protein